MIALQCKLARVALGLGVRETSLLCGVSTDTISRFERGEELRKVTRNKIRKSLEAAGIVFIEGDARLGPGIRVKKSLLKSNSVS